MKNHLQTGFYLFALILLLLMNPAFARAEEEQAPAWESLTRQFLASEIAKFGENYHEDQKGPVVNSEDRSVVAFAFEIKLPENQIVPALSKIADFKDSGTYFSSRAMTIVSGKNNGTPTDSNPEAWISGQITSSLDGKALDDINENNLPLQKAFSAIFEHSTFDPYSSKSASPTTWLTWLMVDSSLRMQITGFATSEKAIQDLKKALDDSGFFRGIDLDDVVLHEAGNVPEWRRGREKNYMENPYHENAGLASVWRFHLVLHVNPLK